MKNIKNFEIALICGLIIAVLFAFWLDYEQQKLSGKMLRLHIIANSDNDYDQDLKLKVRDRVLFCAESLVAGETDIDKATQILNENLDMLNLAAKSEIKANGFNYPVKTQIENVYFPTRDYDFFSLPQGDYNALRVIIGEGGGKNWWCVVFPPLCVTAASDNIKQTAKASGFNNSDLALITEDGAYELKFKSIEVLQDIKNFFK